MMRYFLTFTALLSIFSQYVMGAQPRFKLWPLGEKTYESTPLSIPKYALDMAQMETQFFILEIDENFNYNKHSPIFEVVIDENAPVEITVSWLLGHYLKNGRFVDDIVIPIHQENLHQLPRENFPKKKKLLIEIKSKLTAGIKDWSGDLVIKRLDNKDEIKISLVVKIHKFTLPSVFHLNTTFGFAPWTVLKKHNINYQIEDVLYKKYFDLARDHRIDLHKIYLEFSKNEENLLGNANNPNHTFLNTWKIARGTDTSYTRMQLTDLPVPEQYKTPEAKNEKFWKTLNREARGNKSFYVYFEDEPTPEKLQKIIPALKTIRTWAPDLRLMMTTNWIKELDGLIQIWAPNVVFWNMPNQPTPKKYQELIKNGNELWIYVSCNSHGCHKNEVTGLSDLIIDRPASYAYSFPWVAEAIGASGILYYDTVRAYLESEKSPWLDPKIYNGMGEGNLFYPCPKNVCALNAPDVFPSLRLKILQNSLESLEIYKNAALKNQKIISKREAVVRSPRFWSKQISDYENIKKQALEILDAN